MATERSLPEILAPAGDQDCFLAALAAGADAVYLGLKHFSARMEAENFGMAQLARLTELAHENSRRVYVAMNTLVKPGELAQAYHLVIRLARQACVDGLIIQDLGMINLARQSGFTGKIAFSTLANVSNPAALAQARAFGASRVIIPRELSLDEMRIMGDACPDGLKLECFVHGALCYCVSGRCYWSSYMGGKSSLRGRCVQPCRRNYSRQSVGQKSRPMSGGMRFFSCQDLELGASIQKLLSIPNLESWKIEGRKKGPHYVFHTVSAYRLLRANPDDPKAIETAQQLLNYTLGRPGVKARFNRPSQPMAPGRQTGSGLLAGKIVITQSGEPVMRPRLDLLQGDYLRVGTEDERWHAVLPVKRGVPRGGECVLSLARHKTPRAGTPVFLIDRREPGMLKLLAEWRSKLRRIPERQLGIIESKPRLPHAIAPVALPDMIVRRARQKSAKVNPGKKIQNGVWLGPDALKISSALLVKTVFWLPPDLWPENEPEVSRIVKILWQKGARHFVCNSPWQRGLFPVQLPGDAELVAGPFCNIANVLTVDELAKAGFSAAFASPELCSHDFLELPAHSPLPLGFIIGGFWPVGLSRFGLSALTAGEAFRSPLGEWFWSRNYGGTIWLFPAWPLALESKRQELVKAGYSFFALLEEKAPENLPGQKRQGLFNWNGSLL